MSYFEKSLDELGLKKTPQRLDLIKCLEKLRDNHPTFNELFDEMVVLSPTISRSTLHTNLKAFEKNNLIISFNHQNETHYELNQNLHVNAINNDGSIHDINDQEIESHLEKVRNLINEKHGKIKKFTILVELD